MLVVAAALPLGYFKEALWGQNIPPRMARVDKIAGFLKANLKPGDTVQPLDWTGGAVHAMLLSKAMAATPVYL